MAKTYTMEQAFADLDATGYGVNDLARELGIHDTQLRSYRRGVYRPRPKRLHAMKLAIERLAVRRENRMANIEAFGAAQEESRNHTAA